MVGVAGKGEDALRGEMKVARQRGARSKNRRERRWGMTRGDSKI